VLESIAGGPQPPGEVGELRVQQRAQGVVLGLVGGVGEHAAAGDGVAHDAVRDDLRARGVGVDAVGPAADPHPAQWLDEADVRGQAGPERRPAYLVRKLDDGVQRTRVVGDGVGVGGVQVGERHGRRVGDDEPDAAGH